MILRVPIVAEHEKRIKRSGYGAGRQTFMAGLALAKTITPATFAEIWRNCAGKGSGQVSIDADDSIIAELDALAARFGVTRTKMGRVVVFLGLPEEEPEPEPVQEPVNTEIQELQELLALKEAQLQEGESRLALMQRTLKYLQHALNTGKENGIMLFEIQRALAKETV